LNRGLKSFFVCCRSAVGMWATPLGIVQAQRHVHSATCSGLSAGFTGSPQAFAGEIDAVGVMDQAIEDRIGVGGVADQRVPLIDGKLAGDDGGAAAVAVLEDLQEVVTSRGVERFQAPVVEDEEINAAKRTQETGVAAIATRQSEIGEHSRMVWPIHSLTLRVMKKRGACRLPGFFRGPGGMRPGFLRGVDSMIRFAINSAGEGLGIDG
jgi:hypothetical protein